MKTLFGLTILGLLLLSVNSAKAVNYGQYGEYGSSCSGAYGEQCPEGNLLIDKKIKLSTKGGFNLVDNLAINETRFSKDQKVSFEIAVTNTSEVALKNVEVKDIFPEFLSFVSGNGKYDANTRTLTFVIDSLTAGETTKFGVVGKVIEPKNVSNGSVCVVNQSMATMQDGESVRDNASFCIERKFAVLPAKPITQTPATGPEMLTLIGIIPAGLAGILLRRKSKLG